MKYLSIDIETTGLDPETCQILEFGAVISDTVDTDTPVEELPSFSRVIRHLEIRGDAFAINMNRDLIAQIADGGGSSLEDLAFDFNNWLVLQGFEPKKRTVEITVAGKNVSGFDLPFLKRVPHWSEYIRTGHRVIDPAIGFLTRDDTKVPDLKTCLARAGYNKDVDHRALGDARDVVRCVRWILQGR